MPTTPFKRPVRSHELAGLLGCERTKEHAMTNEITIGLQNNLSELAEARDLARELIALTDTVGGIKLAMVSVFQPFMEEANVDPKTFAAILDESLPELVELVVPIFMDLYTADEIRGLIAFTKTPLGRKGIDSRGTITAGIQAAAGPWTEKFAGKLEKAFGV